MNINTSSKNIRQNLELQLGQLRQVKSFIAGSLVKIYRKCGATNCRCAKGGKKHPAYLLTSKVRGKTKAVYVPVDKVDEVRQWTQEYRKLKRSIKAISDLHEKLIRLHVSEKRKAARPNKKN
jgi:hypothetical protein